MDASGAFVSMVVVAPKWGLSILAALKQVGNAGRNEMNFERQLYVFVSFVK